MAKINDTTNFPVTTPALDDMVLGTDVSNTSNDANGETVNFTFASLRGFFGLISNQTFTSSGTWTRPTGVTRVLIFVTDGGQGLNTSSNVGGAAGDTSIKLIDVSSITSATITIGSGSSQGSSPASGGNSSWSDGSNTVNGGSGGDINLNGDRSASFWGSGAYGAGGVPNGITSGRDGVVFVLEFA